MLRPGVGVALGQVVVVGPQTGRTVDQLADDVGLPGVPIGLGDHVDENPVQCHRPLLLGRPPGHLADRVERQLGDGGVGVRPHPPVAILDLRPGLLGRRPQVGVELGALLPARQRLGKRTPEGVAEVARVDHREVLDQAEQIGAGRHQRAAHVVLRQAVQLPEHGFPGELEIAVQVGLLVLF